MSAAQHCCSAYVPLPHDEVSCPVVPVLDGDDGRAQHGVDPTRRQLAVVEEYHHAQGWCVYIPENRSKRIVPALAMQPTAPVPSHPCVPTRHQSASQGRASPSCCRQSQVSGPASWWQHATLIVENAKSSRSRCEGCRLKIESERVRLGILSKHWNGRLFAQKRWFHLRCFQAGLRVAVSSIECFDGHEGLSLEDKNIAQRHLTSQHSSAGLVCVRELSQPLRACFPSLQAEELLLDKFACACRTVVHQYVYTFKRSLFFGQGEAGLSQQTTSVTEEKDVRIDTDDEKANENGLIICPIMGREMSWAESHVHHDAPSFDEILANYVRLRGLNLKTIRYDLGRFVDQSLAYDFFDYHLHVCRLRVVHMQANLSHLKRKNQTVTDQANDNPDDQPSADDQKPQKKLRLEVKKAEQQPKREEKKKKQIRTPRCDECHNWLKKTLLLSERQTNLCYECRTRTFGSSTWAKKRYSLNEEDLARLKHDTTENPVSVNFSPMKLYLKRDLLEAARKKHGPEFAMSDSDENDTDGQEDADEDCVIAGTLQNRV